jgi:acyl-CoA reductase-like NAD-dependent aldehyde dehydrogenase
VTTTAPGTRAFPWTDSIFVGGSCTPARGGNAVSQEKATGTALATVGVADPDDVAAAVGAAKAAQPAWAALPPAQRAAAIRRLRDVVERRGEEVLRRFARQVHPGMVQLNDTTCLSESTVSFGGWKDSSLGVPTGGDADVEQFTERRWISVQEQPGQYRY